MRLEGLGRLFCVRMVVPDFLWGNGCSSLGQSRRRDEQTKKSRATNVPGKFIREASRLGDVGPFSGPWVSRTGRPAKTDIIGQGENSVPRCGVCRCGSRGKIAFLTIMTTAKLLFQPCIFCINLQRREVTG